MGTDRLRLLAPVAGQAETLRVWSDDASGVSAWALEFTTGRFWLVISPDLSRGFSGEGQVLAELAGSNWEPGLPAVRTQLKWQAVLDADAVAAAAGIPARQATTALAALGSRGLVCFDPESGAYFHRELPFDLSRVESLHPRLKAARKLLAAGGVRWKRRAAEGGEAMVSGSGVEHRVRLNAGDDRCTCRWFSRYQGERGVCKHILAARIDLADSDDGA